MINLALAKGPYYHGYLPYCNYWDEGGQHQDLEYHHVLFLPSCNLHLGGGGSRLAARLLRWQSSLIQHVQSE